MYRLDLLVLDLERLQEEFRHVDRFNSRCLARNLRYDRFQELFPNDLRLNRFIEGTRSHFHLERSQSVSLGGVWGLTSSELSVSTSTCFSMALSALYTRTSVNGPPTSHLSSRETKILNGRDPEYSAEGLTISSFCPVGYIFGEQRRA